MVGALSENGAGAGAVTALMVAASRGDYEAVLRLLPESEVNARDRLGNTALIYAAAGGHAEVLRLLLREGADASLKNGAGLSALERATNAGRRDAVEVLRAASDAARLRDVLTELDSRLLDACRGEETVEVVRLLSRGASTEARSKGTGWTPLVNACAFGHVEAARVLLDAGADVNCAAADGRTPLHLSAELGDVELISLLLERGADASLRDHHGETPLTAAVRGGAGEAARALAQAGATN
jgi:ankyrin repeat protein